MLKAVKPFKAAHLQKLATKSMLNGVLVIEMVINLGVCVPQPSALSPYPRPSTLGPHLVGPRRPKYCKNKFMNKAYYLFKIILTQD